QRLRAGDALRLVVHERRPAEDLALLQHEPGGIDALVAADLEFDAARIEHEEVIGRIAGSVEHRTFGELLAPRELGKRLERSGRNAVEELADAPRAPPTD